MFKIIFDIKFIFWPKFQIQGGDKENLDLREVLQDYWQEEVIADDVPMDL